MATTVQFKRGSTSNNDSFTGLVGEISIDTTLGTIRVHDGSTAGGSELALSDLTNATVGGHLIPTADITYDLGSSDFRFRDVYLSGSTINLGGATISQDSVLNTGSHDISKLELPLITSEINIGKYVWICANSYIMKGVNIGDGTIIGVRSTVLSDIPPWKIAYGTPCKSIKNRKLIE